MRAAVRVVLTAALAGAAIVAAPLQDCQRAPRTAPARIALEAPVAPVRPDPLGPVVPVEPVDAPVIPEGGVPVGCLVLRGHATPTVIAASPDGRFVAAGDTDGTLRLWEARTGRPLRAHAAHVIHVRSLEWSRDSALLATAGGRKVRIWNVATGAEPLVILREYPNTSELAFGPDGRLHDGEGRVWDPVSGARLDATPARDDVAEVVPGNQSEPDLDEPFEGPSNGGAIGLGGGDDNHERVTVSADGTWTIVGDRIARGRPGARRPWNAGVLDEALLAPNGSWLVTVSEGVITTWNATTGYRITTLPVRSGLVEISDDNRWICTAGRWWEHEDRTLRIWDAWTGAPRDAIRLPARPTCMTTRGRHLWVGCEDGTIRRFAAPR